jgi:hypothetical protein
VESTTHRLDQADSGKEKVMAVTSKKFFFYLLEEDSLLEDN